MLAQAGAYDPPAQIEQSVKDYVQLFSSQYELSGRKIELVLSATVGSL